MRRIALLIGSQTHGLTGVRNDVATMTDQLARRRFSTVRCEGSPATRAGILDGFERLIRDARDTDAIVVYYSGHGGLAAAPVTAAGNSRVTPPRLQFIVPADYNESTESDFRGITAPELSVLLARLTEATRNVTVLLDTCHAAHLARDEDLRVKALRPIAYLDIAEHLSRLRRHGLDTTIRHALGNQDAVRLVACGREQSAYEYTNSAGRRTGIFTESMALALTETGDQPVAWATLLRRVRHRVQALVPSQRPEAEGPALRVLFQTITWYPSGAAVVPSGSPESALNADVTIEWGRVIGGEPCPLPAAGAVVHAGEHVYVRVRNDGDATVHVSVVHLDVLSRGSLITSLDPSGIAVGPGEEHVVGGDELDGRLDGIPLTWPHGVDRGTPRPERIVVLVGSAPQALCWDLPCPAGSDSALYGIPEVLPINGRFRDLAADPDGVTRRDIHSIVFHLDPAPPPSSGPTRPVDGTIFSPADVRWPMGDMVFGDKYGGDHVRGNKIVQTGGTSPRGRQQVILLMSANPGRDQPLRLDEERREIDRAVTYAQAGDRLVVRTADAIRLDDLQSALLRHRPAIVHFSGHGTASAGIIVTDDSGDARPVPPQALNDLFRILRGGLRCVVLNACFTEAQARAISAHVPCVVGMRNRVLDDTAIRFAGGFYEGIAHAQSIQVSFDLGCNRLRLHGHTDSGTPRLIAAPGAADRPVIPLVAGET